MDKKQISWKGLTLGIILVGASATLYLFGYYGLFSTLGILCYVLGLLGIVAAGTVLRFAIFGK